MYTRATTRFSVVDLLRVDDGYVVLEVNAAVEFDDTSRGPRGGGHLDLVRPGGCGQPS
jgi:hypothetical protein